MLGVKINLIFLHYPVGYHLIYVFYYEFRCFLHLFAYCSHFCDFYLRKIGRNYEARKWHLRTQKITYERL
jgi:hypothetical protein